MSEMKLEQYLTEENINNLGDYVLNNCQDAGDIGHIDAEFQEWRNRYKVSLGLVTWHISKDYMPKFWYNLSLGPEGWDRIQDALEAEDGTIKEFYAPLLSDIEEAITGVASIDHDEFYDLMGIDFEKVDNRLSGLITTSAHSLREIARIINERMVVVEKDRNIVKDFDGILTFDTATGRDFKLSLCFDKVPPIAENNNAMIMRTPITQEDAELYLGESYVKVQSRIEHINGLVTDLLTGKSVKGVEYLIDYAANAIDVILTKAFLDQIITFVSFGGTDDWRVHGDDSPNNIECFKILDAEVENIIKMLDALPKEEGVDIHSIDIDTLAVFGRNNDNRVVTPAVQGFTEEKLLRRYSKGFERLLSIRLGMSDNAHFFRA